MSAKNALRMSLGRWFGTVTGVATLLVATLGISPSASASPPATADGPAGAIEADLSAGADVIELDQGIFCNPPALRTQFGPLYSCNQVGTRMVQFGFFSPITQDFEPDPTIGWRTIVSHEVVAVDLLRADGGGRFVSSHAHSTIFGPVYYGTQNTGLQGRFGTWSPFTRRFNALSGWLPLAGDTA